MTYLALDARNSALIPTGRVFAFVTAFFSARRTDFATFDLAPETFAITNKADDSTT